MKGQRFAHSGDLGDIIYALPTIRACGGGRLALFHHPSNRTSHGMSQARANRIIPLLKLQPYIEDAFFTEDRIDHNINGFRDHRAGNTADNTLATMGLPPQERNRKWLEVEPREEVEVVICRTERYQNPNFPWVSVLQKYQGRCGFIGMRHEYTLFTDQFGDNLPFVEAKNLLEVAQIIAGSKLYIGNYTSATAIAEGLKHTSVVEVYPPCHMPAMFHRIGVAHGWDGSVELPEL